MFLKIVMEESFENTLISVVEIRFMKTHTDKDILSFTLETSDYTKITVVAIAQNNLFLWTQTTTVNQKNWY